MKHSSFLIVMGAVLALTSAAQAQDSCAQFNHMVQQAYNFNGDSLTRQQASAKERQLDRFWTEVKANRKTWLPCLRAALARPSANAYFRFDGSNLLVALDPSTASKAQQVRAYTSASFKFCAPRRWMNVLALRGTEGFDVSKAAERWMASDEGHYSLPEHGGMEVGEEEGAYILYGSMNEAQATPALLRIINQPDHPARKVALGVLAMEMTPESLKAMSTLPAANLSSDMQDAVTDFFAHPPLVQRRAKPLTSRAQFLRVFHEVVQGNAKPFFDLAGRVTDGEKDVAAVMKPEDLPLLRQVRRRFAATDNPHLFGIYTDFSRIILTLIWKPEMARPAADSDGVTVL